MDPVQLVVIVCRVVHQLTQLLRSSTEYTMLTPSSMMVTRSAWRCSLMDTGRVHDTISSVDAPTSVVLVDTL